MALPGNVVWRDYEYEKIIGATIAFAVSAFLAFGGMYYWSELSLGYHVLIVVVLLFFGAGLLGFFLDKTSMVTTDGILVGNITKVGPDVSLRHKRPPLFLSWNEIAHLSIVNKEVTRYGAGHVMAYIPRPFLVVKSKKGEQYFCLLGTPEKFTSALASLNRSHLLIHGSPHDIELDYPPLFTYDRADTMKWLKFSTIWMLCTIAAGGIWGLTHLTQGKWSPTMIIIYGVVIFLPSAIYLAKITKVAKH